MTDLERSSAECAYDYVDRLAKLVNSALRLGQDLSAPLLDQWSHILPHARRWWPHAPEWALRQYVRAAIKGDPMPKAAR